MPRAAIASDHLHVLGAEPTEGSEAHRTEQLREARLIKRVLAGDASAGRMLYNEHAPRVHRLLFRLTGDVDLAQELTQDTFIRAFGKLDTFRGEAAFSTWLHRIAVTMMLNGVRKIKRFSDREADLEEAAGLSTQEQSTEPDLRERLARAIDALPEVLRVTLVMHDVEGFTHGEISGVLGVPDGTCKSRLSAARARLRTALADFATDRE
ncbi:MAG: sigma-70 family RNA polymerase sigma factor [Gemmatimonadaceae bacterium]|nr:sigma-70 family RNA polymerase sigma factor [Gemmatimonadaceae bacterium]MDQ3520324.1 sigma-70 family RNA polymerase sigma factor [Gemmatimonadota bacterium]